MFDSALELDHSLSGAAGVERLEFRAAIRLGAVLVERVAQVFLATLMTVHMRRDWRSMANRDVNALRQTAADAGYGSLLLGIDLALRDADAHGDYRLTEGGVEFTSDRAEYTELTEDELVDRVLAASESCLAIHTGIVCVLATRGVPVEELDQDLLEMTDEQQLALAMGINGISVERIEIQEGETVVIDGTSAVRIHKPLTLAASIHPHLPEDAHDLLVRVQDPELTVTVEGPVAMLDEWQAAQEGIEKEARMVELLYSYKVNGRRIATRQKLRKWAAIKALEAASTDDATSSVTALHELSGRIEDAKLEKHMRSMLRLIEARKGRGTATDRDRRTLGELARWASLNIQGPSQDPHSYPPRRSHPTSQPLGSPFTHWATTPTKMTAPPTRGGAVW